MQTHAPSIALYTREDLPRLSLLTEAAWAHLAHGRTLTSAPARGVHWAGLELALTPAALQLGTVAYPPTYPALAAASMPAARLNISAQTLAAVAFDLEFSVARAEGRATDEWLVERAPRVLGRPSWQAFLDTALFRLGRKLEHPPALPALASQVPQVLGPRVGECISALMSLCVRHPFQALAASYGAERLRCYLVSLLDVSLLDLDVLSGRREEAAAPLLVAVAHLHTLREQLASWSPPAPSDEVPEELERLARRALEAAEYPVPPETHAVAQLPC